MSIGFGRVQRGGSPFAGGGGHTHGHTFCVSAPHPAYGVGRLTPKLTGLTQKKERSQAWSQVATLKKRRQVAWGWQGATTKKAGGRQSKSVEVNAKVNAVDAKKK